MNYEELLHFESLINRRDELNAVVKNANEELNKIDSMLRDVDRKSYIVLTWEDVVSIDCEIGAYQRITARAFTKISPLSSEYETIKTLMEGLRCEH